MISKRIKYMIVGGILGLLWGGLFSPLFSLIIFELMPKDLFNQLGYILSFVIAFPFEFSIYLTKHTFCLNTDCPPLMIVPIVIFSAMIGTTIGLFISIIYASR